MKLMNPTNSTTATKPGTPTSPTQPTSPARRLADLALTFTQAYKDHLHDPIPIREAHCLKTLFPATCLDIQDQDLFAGRKMEHLLACFHLQYNANGKLLQKWMTQYLAHEPVDDDLDTRHKLIGSFCGYCYDHVRLQQLSKNPEFSPEEQDAISGMVDFWFKEQTKSKFVELLPREVKESMDLNARANGYVGLFFRLTCASLDYDKLLRLGIPGLKDHIGECRARAASSGGDLAFYDGMLMALDVLVDVCCHYERQARDKARTGTDGMRRRDLLQMADSLDAITKRAPSTLREAIQLFLIYSVLAHMLNYGRMDVYLGDFYADDIDSGRLTEAEAKRLLAGLWPLLQENTTKWMGRLLIGGKGRRNQANADRFALAALDVTQELRLTEPNLTLRFYQGQNPALFSRALDLIGSGCVHPSLYNDDVNIPWLARTYGATEAEACAYLPAGCGEYVLEGLSLNSPNSTINYTAALDLVLHNGFDTRTQTQIGLQLGTLEHFDSYDKLVDALKKQISHTNGLLATRHKLEVQAEAESAAFLFMSILNADCIARGKSIVDGGIRYNGAIVESFGLTNVADSLFVIRDLVYERKIMTLETLVEIVDANFEGYEKERRLMLALPKYGNDDVAVDRLFNHMHEFVCADTLSKAEATGFDYFTICSMNSGGHGYGLNTKASPDGRRAGEPLALGNNPTSGRDRNGATALLNSLALPKPMHSGFVQNLKLSPAIFKGENRRRLEALLDTYFAGGGTQLMITVVNKDDLEKALIEPEKYQNLLVRVAGFTARFVTLQPSLQQEILNRTLHG
ncbi:MAG: hypothetical protein JXR37_29745 [Kiritimatiellae bacterium]|nr:hypothetical protein [Kiritimatiellia bacterium]